MSRSQTDLTCDAKPGWKPSCPVWARDAMSGPDSGVEMTQGVQEMGHTRLHVTLLYPLTQPTQSYHLFLSYLTSATRMLPGAPLPPTQPLHQPGSFPAELQPPHAPAPTPPAAVHAAATAGGLLPDLTAARGLEAAPAAAEQWFAGPIATCRLLAAEDYGR